MSERFFILTPTPTDKTETIASGLTFPVYLDAEGKPMKWSGTFPIPAIGARVWVRMNSIGWAVVKGYFESHGYVGLMTLPEDPPKWLRDQQRRDRKDPHHANDPKWMKEGIGCEFGNEICLEKPVPKTEEVVS